MDQGGATDGETASGLMGNERDRSRPSAPCQAKHLDRNQQSAGVVEIARH